MNKAQLIEALSDRLGDKKAAGTAVDGLVDVIVRTVNKGEKVNITGFGVFEKRARAARTARNPRTGETVKVKKTNVPAFRAGTTFKDVVSGAKKLPKVDRHPFGGQPLRRTTTSAAASRPRVPRPPGRRPARYHHDPYAGRGSEAGTRAPPRSHGYQAPAKATTAKKATPAKAAAKKATRGEGDRQGEDHQGVARRRSRPPRDGGEEEAVQSKQKATDPIGRWPSLPGSDTQDENARTLGLRWPRRTDQPSGGMGLTQAPPGREQLAAARRRAQARRLREPRPRCPRVRSETTRDPAGV